MNHIKSLRKLPLIFLLLGTVLLFNSCKKVDELLDLALDFDGIFANSIGWEVDLYELGTDNIGHAKYSKAGTPVSGFSVGTSFAYDMERVDDDSWRGMVRSSGGYSSTFTTGNISISGTTLTVSPDNRSEYTLVKPGSSGSGGGTGGGGGTTTTLAIDQLIAGSEGDKKILYFTLPANVKKMEIHTTESTNAYRNTADLFVRRGSAPTVTKTPTYSWVADCFGIKPNREDEVCVFDNPASGTWYIMLFGYNTYFSSQLKVTLTQ